MKKQYKKSIYVVFIILLMIIAPIINSSSNRFLPEKNNTIESGFLTHIIQAIFEKTYPPSDQDESISQSKIDLLIITPEQFSSIIEELKKP